MSAMRELVAAVLNYSSAREAVRAAPEGSTDLSQALGWAASAWDRVADVLVKATPASDESAHVKTLLGLIADSDVREYTDEESAAIRWLEGIAA